MSERPPRTPLVDPRGYFSRDRDPLPPGLAVFGGYVLALLLTYYHLATVVKSHLVGPPVDFELQVVRSVLFGLVVGGCVALLVVAAVLHFGAGRGGSLGDALAVAGWGYAPNLLALPVQYLYARQKLEQASFRGFTEPGAMRAEVEAAQSGGADAVSVLLALAVVGWSVYVLGYGIAETHDSRLADALVVASVVGLFAFLWSVL